MPADPTDDPDQQPTLQVEIWSDVVCPWCYIGKRRFEQALESFEDADRVELVHRSFQLDPSAVRGQTEPTLERLSGKYGLPTDQALAMMRQVEDVARGDGLEYDHLQTLSGSTLDAHRLLQWSAGQGRQQQLLEVLYRGYFSQRRSLFDTGSLVGLATEAGLDGEAARALLDSEEFGARVAQDQRDAARLGAGAVPFFVVDRAVGVVGAQPTEVLVAMLDRARGRQAV